MFSDLSRPLLEHIIVPARDPVEEELAAGVIGPTVDKTGADGIA